MQTKRGFLVWDEMAPWIIGIVALVIGLISYMFLSGKWNDGFEFFKQLWRFGR